MVTKWYKILKSLKQNGYVDNTFPVMTVKDYQGTEHSTGAAGQIGSQNYINGAVASNNYLPNTGLYGNNNYLAIYVGSGNTPATESDYNLETPITTLTRTSTSNGAGCILEDGVVVGVTRDITYQNNTEDNITINEIGVFIKWYYLSTNANTFLIERTVLDTPIVLAPTESATVTFKMY